MLLRPAERHDLDALHRLEAVAFDSDRFTRRQLWYLLNRAHGLTLVAEDETGRLLGYGTLLLRRSSAKARLYSFCVHPEQRGQGLGRRLLRRLVALAGEHACGWLELEVRADNTAAQALYRSEGFTPTAWLVEYYEDGCAAWRMARELRLSLVG